MHKEMYLEEYELQFRLINITLQSIQILLKNDKILLEIKVKEECINHRLAIYLERLLEEYNIKNISVDLEYNKSKGLNKRTNGNIRPDIVAHERESNNRNLIVLEAKKRYITKHDKKKLLDLIEDPYNYKIASHISYLPLKKHFLVRFYFKNNHRTEIPEVLKFFKDEFVQEHLALSLNKKGLSFLTD